MNGKYPITNKSDRTLTKIDYIKDRGFDSSISNSKNSYYIYNSFRSKIELLHLRIKHEQYTNKITIEKKQRIFKIKTNWSTVKKMNNSCNCQVLSERSNNSPVFEMVMVK